MLSLLVITMTWSVSWSAMASLLHSASAFDRKVNQSLKMFTKFLPPVLLVFLAIGGGFILAAILLPLLELQSMVG